MDLPEPVRPTRAHVVPAGDVQVDVAGARTRPRRRRSAGRANCTSSGPSGSVAPPTGSGSAAEQPAQPEHRAEAGLQVGQVAGQLVDLADEHRGDQEQRDQRRGVEAVVDDQRDADQRGGRRARACSSVPVRRPIRASSAEHDREPAVHLGGELGAAAQDVAPGRGWRAGRRAPATPSSMAAAWSVQAISSSTLRAETCGQQRRDDRRAAATPATREQEERRPPRRRRRRSTAGRRRARCGSPARRSGAAGRRPRGCRRRPGRAPRRRPAR